MIRLVNISASMVVFAGERYLPGEVIETEVLHDGFKRLIAEGRLEVEDDRQATKAVAEEVSSKKKAKKEPKTVDEAENGGEYK